MILKRYGKKSKGNFCHIVFFCKFATYKNISKNYKNLVVNIIDN